MRAIGNYADWSGGAKVPSLTAMNWNVMAIPAAVLAVMAILQIISFNEFKDWLQSIRIGWPTAVAVGIIVAELWGALSLLRIPMPPVLRFIGVALAILVTGFWFIETLYLATSTAGQLPNSGYFGKYLAQSPGWWTVLEATVMLFLIVYAAELLKWRRASR